MKYFFYLIVIVFFSHPAYTQETTHVWTFSPTAAIIEFDGGNLAIYPIEESNGEFVSEVPLGLPQRSSRPSPYRPVGFLERIVFFDNDFVSIETSEEITRGAFYRITTSQSSVGFEGVPLVVLSFVSEGGGRDRMVFHVADRQLHYSQSSPPIALPVSRYDANSRIIYSIDTGSSELVDYRDMSFRGN
jgi:hypothetical protein